MARTARSTSCCCRARVRAEPVAWIAAALMTMGLLAKTALFPLHLWLPPAHAGAPAPGSAVLSALVVKGSFFLIVRHLVRRHAGAADLAAAQLLATLGAGAILFGSVLALRQARLKLLIAYSTIAQIGYLFFIFPLAGGDSADALARASRGPAGGCSFSLTPSPRRRCSWRRGSSRRRSATTGLPNSAASAARLPMTVVAFGLAGLSLMGVPPSGGFVAKWLLLSPPSWKDNGGGPRSCSTGGLLAGGYVLLVLGRLMAARRCFGRRCHVRARVAGPRGGGAGRRAVRRRARLRAARALRAAADRRATVVEISAR